MVILPSVASGQLVAVVFTVAVMVPVPAATFVLTDPVQPELSVKVTVCGPGATLVKTLPACGGPPSNEYMYGAVPLVGVTVMLPSVESGQVVAVEETVAVMVEVVLIVKLMVLSEPFTSVT